MDLLVGIYTCLADNTPKKMYFQANNLQMDADEYEAKDEKGNTVKVQYINHRVTASIEAIIANKASAPVPGQVIKLTGVTLPTVQPDGSISGSFKIDPDSNSEIEFKVNGSVTISQSNSDYPHCSFSVIRYLVNGVPNTEDSDSDND